MERDLLAKEMEECFFKALNENRIDMSSQLYWYGQLDFNSRNSHPSFFVLREKIDRDLKVFLEAREIYREWKKFGYQLSL